jgi:hypothetical protein
VNNLLTVTTIWPAQITRHALYESAVTAAISIPVRANRALTIGGVEYELAEDADVIIVNGEGRQLNSTLANARRVEASFIRTVISLTSINNIFSIFADIGNTSVNQTSTAAGDVIRTLVLTVNAAQYENLTVNAPSVNRFFRVTGDVVFTAGWTTQLHHWAAMNITITGQLTHG